MHDRLWISRINTDFPKHANVSLLEATAEYLLGTATFFSEDERPFNVFRRSRQTACVFQLLRALRMAEATRGGRGRLASESPHRHGSASFVHFSNTFSAVILHRTPRTTYLRA